MPASIADRMMALFAGHMGAHGTHGAPKQLGIKWVIKDTAKTLRKPVTVALWQAHLDGTVPLGVIPIREDNTCLWGSIDVDEYATNFTDLITRIESLELPLAPARSKSGGLHLFLFTKEPVAAGVMQTALKNLAAQLGVAGSEIFPKQTQILGERGDMGNWMIMPYFGNTYGGKLREQVGVRKTMAELTVAQFLTKCEALKADEAQVTEWATHITRPSPPPNGGAGKGKKLNTVVSYNGVPFSDGPVCLQIMAADGVQAGGQNTVLINMGTYYKKKDPNDWKAKLEIANREYLTPPGSSEGLMSVYKSLEKTGEKTYHYQCKVEPLVSHCQSQTCRLRKYGVGEENDFPSISGLSKLNTDPPLWFVEVDNHRFEMNTDDLYYYNRFSRVCFDRGNMVFGIMSQGNWQALLKPLMDDVTMLNVPPEVSRDGQFRELLEEFCTNRQKGQAREDLLAGRPWESEEDGRHYFRLKDFQSFLVKQNVKDLTRGQITQRIKNLEGDYKFMVVKKTGLNAWYVPSSTFGENVPIDVPKHERDPI